MSNKKSILETFDSFLTELLKRYFFICYFFNKRYKKIENINIVNLEGFFF